jgi:hypothetical protein
LPITVTLPNGDQIVSSHEANLLFPNLPEGALHAHLFPQLHGQALLSIGTFCKAGCTATFTATTVKIAHLGKTVLEGSRVLPRLWNTTMTEQNPPAWQANGAHTIHLKSNAIKYLHVACFSPTTETWTKAIDHGFFRTILLLNARDVHKHLPKSMATTMGHLDQQRKNVQSTKPKKSKPRPSYKEVLTFDEDTSPEKEDITATTFASIVAVDEQQDGKSYSDLTGRFPSISTTGNLYVLVLYTYDDNTILVEPLPRRSDAEQLKAYTKILNRASKGSELKLHWMDNEASKAVKDLLTKEFKLDYQLVPPHIHQHNAAERAIRTFKNHFITGLCSANNNFPIRLWDKLLPQAKITLNLMRASQKNPAISAYKAINGIFDNNKTPLAPPGCKVIIHEKPSQRGS